MDDLAVLAIPAALVTGLVLLGLGVDGRTDPAGRGGGEGGSRTGPPRPGSAASARGRWSPCAAGRGWPLAWRSSP